MSDVMRPIPFAQLMDWILSEHEEHGSIFGIRKAHVHEGGAEPIFSERIETPFGPAAGPNSQLAQNIVASYVAGARFFELKTPSVWPSPASRRPTSATTASGPPSSPCLTP